MVASAWWLTDKSDQLHPLQDVRYQGSGPGYQLAGKTPTPPLLLPIYIHPSIHYAPHAHPHSGYEEQEEKLTLDALRNRHRKEAKDRNIS